MISVAEAESIVTQCQPTYPIEEVPLERAYGRVLREDVFADRDLPPYNSVAMDGIAIDSAVWQQGRRCFPIAGIQAAGDPQKSLPDADACLEVMTGSVLPKGTDAVVRYEDVTMDGDTAWIAGEVAVDPMQNIRQQASDRQVGEKLVSDGTILFSPQLAVLAFVGHAQVKVDKRPSIGIVSTGNELVGIDQPVQPHQIRRSNVYALQASLNRRHYLQTCLYHLNDEYNALWQGLKEILDKHDILLLSGGVSRGKYDLVPQALDELGVTVQFHKVQQRPGKPFWFGTSPGGTLVYALPGNPVSALTCLHRYTLPQLQRSAGSTDTRQEMAVLNVEICFSKPLTLFRPVKIVGNQEGKIFVEPVAYRNSGDLAALTDSDGFIELDAELETFPAGYTAPFYRWI